MVVALDPSVRARLPMLSRLPAAHTAVVTGVAPMSLIEAALRWTEAHLEYFEPDPSGRPRAPVTLPESPLLELTVVCRWLHHRRLSPDARTMVERCLDHAAEVFHRRSVRDRLFRRTAFFQYYAWLVVLLHDCGRLRDPADLATVQRLVDADHADIHNRTHPAHGLMELRYVLDLGRIRHRLPGHRALFRDNVLAAPVDPLYVSDFEAYAVTHIVMYLSDMGLQPVTALSRGQVERTRRVVDDLLALYVGAGHFDLTAELLLCRRALAAPATPLSAFAWRCLGGAQRPDGTVPGPHFDPRRADSLPDDRRDRYVWSYCYHSTLVAAMAAAMEEDSGV